MQTLAGPAGVQVYPARQAGGQSARQTSIATTPVMQVDPVGHVAEVQSREQ
jgi:hypothetical protein